MKPLANWLAQHWFHRQPAPVSFFRPPLPWPVFLLLLPLHALFVWLSGKRRLRFLAEAAQGKIPPLPVSVIVVGNITVGGAGKTPLTLWLAQALKARGYRPGIISRGYGRRTDDSTAEALAVTPETSPEICGDEPLLLARRSGCPVWVARQRREAGVALLAAHPEVNLLLCDDGLQHYALPRDAEIAVFDTRGIGNGWRLPLGPLREPVARLNSVDAVVLNGTTDSTALPDLVLPADQPAFAMQLQPGAFYALHNPAQTCTAADLLSTGKPLFALAGIGHPQRFFDTLAAVGLDCTCRAFPDHHAYTAADLTFADSGILLLTEKDAVKCGALTPGQATASIWVLPVDAAVPQALVDTLLEKIRGHQAA